MKTLQRYNILIEKFDISKEICTTIIRLPKGSTPISVLGTDVGRCGYLYPDTYVKFRLSVLNGNSDNLTKYKLLIVRHSISNIEIDDEYTYLGSSVNHYNNDVGDLCFYNYDVFYKEL